MAGCVDMAGHRDIEVEDRSSIEVRYALLRRAMPRIAEL